VGSSAYVNPPIATANAPGAMPAGSDGTVLGTGAIVLKSITDAKADLISGLVPASQIPGSGVQSYHTLRAMSLTGITSPIVIFDDFAMVASDNLPLGNRQSAGTGSAAGSTAYQTAFLIQSGVNASSIYWVQPLGAGCWKTTSPLTTPWYAAWRGALTTGVDAQAIIGARIRDAAVSNNISFGGVGSVSTVNFSLSAAGTGVIDSGVALDTVVHTHEIWRSTGNIHYAIDGVDVGNCVVPGAWTGRSLPQIPLAINGTTAANRALHAHWYLLVAEAE
jgi:hypothetical protein